MIVGGVAGGATAAARLRRLSEDVEIVMFERGEHVSFANCGLPYYIGETIKSRDALLVQTPEGLNKRYKLDVRNFNEVVKIDRKKKQVKVRDLKGKKEYSEKYDYLVLSPGAEPVRPPIKGIDEAKNLFTLRNVKDTDEIKKFVDEEKPKKAVVVGGGFIGLEMAENLVDRGVKVSIVEMLDQVMSPLDLEMAAIVHKHLKSKGVKLVLEDGVSSFQDSGKTVETQSGKKLDADLIILSIGVRPETALAKETGLDLNERGAIKVDETMKTSDENIYAIGDAVEIQDYIFKEPTMVPLAWPANRQGRIVADNVVAKIAGETEKDQVEYPGTLGVAIVKVFDLSVAVTGHNEKVLKDKQVDYQVIHIHPKSNAGYYPTARQIALKIIYSKSDGKILGAQAVGEKGVDKRIDVISTAIKGDIKVWDLMNLELAYAPPYSSAKDPVNMLGYIAEDLKSSLVEIIQWNEANELIKAGAYFLDVRDPEELVMGQLQGAVNIPLSELRDRLEELPKEKTIHTYCQVGLRGYIAARILKQNGFLVKNLDGGYKTYSAVYEEDQDFFVPTDERGRAELSEREEKVSYKAEMKDNEGEVSEKVTAVDMSDLKISLKLDACGLQCPGPIQKVFQGINQINDGDVMQVSATDPAFLRDVKVWAGRTGNTILKTQEKGSEFIVWIQKGNKDNSEGLDKTSEAQGRARNTDKSDSLSLIVFNGDLDKAIAAFIIANGAASFGKKVTMFFTFWGLNVIRRSDPPKVKKSLLERMFGWMMPKGPSKLNLSHMNMAGMGPRMIKYMMNKKNVDSLEELMKQALDAGVDIVACSMSMDIMGIKKQELIDGVSIGGVATYLGKADESNTNLFV